MRLKVLLISNDPPAAMADSQLLRERGLLVFTAFNPQNLAEHVEEIKPDVVFFDPQKINNELTDVYNLFVSDVKYAHIPVIFTLSEDDIYLVTRTRTKIKKATTKIADNIVGAVKMALTRATARKQLRLPHLTIPLSIGLPRA